MMPKQRIENVTSQVEKKFSFMIERGRKLETGTFEVLRSSGTTRWFGHVEQKTKDNRARSANALIPIHKA